MKLEPKSDDDTKGSEGNGRKYFSQVEDISVLALPAKVTRPVSVEVDGNLQSKLKEQAEPKVSKLILDLCKVSETNVSLIKLIISTMQRCQTAKVPIRVVASSKQGEELKSFQETSDIPIANTMEEARAGLS